MEYNKHNNCLRCQYYDIAQFHEPNFLQHFGDCHERND